MHQNMFVIPSKEGIQSIITSFSKVYLVWIPTYVGMTIYVTAVLKIELNIYPTAVGEIIFLIEVIDSKINPQDKQFFPHSVSLYYLFRRE
ncbi:MAG: hypothetical protein Q7U68_03565, partial [Candidatus Roizmanbacteria bacterium]|nr:hypothetical protein [Candidatus Roizmanbacteria bacterium]